MIDLFGNQSSAQSSIDFPAGLTERYRPHSLDEFVGLEKPKKICARLAARPIESAWLFVGPSGTGKTTMALTLAELGHSTGHASRLDRKFDAGATFGSCDYSREELVAEFTAAFLCAAVGVSNERVELNHAAYIDGWLKALRDDKKLLVMAAQKAQRAADLVQGKVFDAVAEVPAIEAVAA